MIQLNNVVKIYNKALLLRCGVKWSNAHDRGWRVCLHHGTFGIRKSTLLHILGCMDTMTEGEYELDGIRVQDLKPEQLTKSEVPKSVLSFSSSPDEHLHGV